MCSAPRFGDNHRTSPAFPATARACVVVPLRWPSAVFE
jgi:hypothetical protein